MSTPPPPPPPPGHAPRLTRSTSDRYIAGVCGGLGAHFNVDPVLLRIAFVVLIFVGGAGLILYLAAWLLIPETGAAGPLMWHPRRLGRRHNLRAVPAGVVLIAAVVLLAGSFNFDHPGLIWGLGLVAVGVLLLVQEQRQPLTGPVAGPLTDPPSSYAASFSAPPATAAGFTTGTPAVMPASMAPARPRSILGALTVAAALLGVGVAALLDTAGAVSVSLATYFAIALVITGAGLVAGTWFGRSRALVVLGVALLPFAAAAALVTEPFSGGTGNVTIAPANATALQGEYHLAAGQLTVDLTQVPVGANRTVAVTVALGQLTVVVPPNTDVVITAHAGAGHIDLFGATDDGVNIDSTAAASPTTGGSVLHLSLSVGFGEVQVISDSSPAAGQ